MASYRRSYFIKWIFLSALLSSAFARQYTDPSQLKKTTYDYIVVGAGTAGNVIAARLTENPNISVLVLEAGVSNEGVLGSEVPLLAPTLAPDTIYDWNYTTTPQPGLNGRAIPYLRGRLLGGSSSINYMTYSHGSSDDWDRYARITEDDGWKWDNMKQYIQKNEKFVPPVDKHDVTGQIDPALHGFHGAVSVSVSGFPVSSDARVIQTTQELPSEFPYKNDTSGGNVLGIGWLLSASGNGIRSSSATAYLQPAINRPNLDVLIHAQVTKLIKDGESSGWIPSFRTVQFAVTEGAPLHTVTATHEVVLSAGSIGTPTILQLSGIGDPDDLAAAGIKTLVPNPSVGKNLSDHVFQPNIFTVSSNQSTLDGIFQDPSTLNEALGQWNQSRTGPLVYPYANQYGYLRLPDNASIFESVPDPSAGPNAAHMEILFTDFFLSSATPQPPTGNFHTVATFLISPTSRGTIKITSSNPFTAPLIDPNYLSTPFDIFTLVASVKLALRAARSHAFSGFILGPFGALAAAHTDEEIAEYARQTANLGLHAAGTAAMSPRGARWGVVDPDLKVKGVGGLRVVDGSVLPYVPSAHLHGPIYLAAERAADLIKEDWKRS